MLEHNSNSEPNQTLDDVLHQILLETEADGESFARARLEFWIARFPEFKQEIVEFFAHEFLLDNLPEKIASRQENAIFAEQSRKAFDRIIAEQKARRASAADSTVEKIESLQAAAAKQNLNIPQLAHKVGLSRQLLISLEQRLVKPATISRKLKTRLADALKVRIESVAAYFEQPAAFLPGASYKSAEQPALGERQDFNELVKKDLKLTDEQKRALLD